MEKTNPNLPEGNDELVNLGAHDPKIDLVRNKNLFKKSIIFAGSFVVILMIILGFRYIGNKSAQNKANQADAALVNATDSASTAAAFDMYEKVANDGSYAANMRAKMVTAVNKYQQGDYQAALDILDGFSSKSIVANTGVECLRGDCYANLDQNDKAVAAFQNALDEAGNNPELVPYILNKLANLYHVQGDKAKEYEVLVRIQTEYPNYDRTIESRVARAK